VRDSHPDLAEPEPAQLDMHRADDLGAGDRNERPVERPARGPRLDVDGRLRRDSVALLCDRGEQDCEREAVVVARGADLERRVGHAQILARASARDVS
jgi:hypothetical protein